MFVSVPLCTVLYLVSFTPAELFVFLSQHLTKRKWYRWHAGLLPLCTNQATANGGRQESLLFLLFFLQFFSFCFFAIISKAWHQSCTSGWTTQLPSSHRAAPWFPFAVGLCQISPLEDLEDGAQFLNKSCRTHCHRNVEDIQDECRDCLSRQFKSRYRKKGILLTKHVKARFKILALHDTVSTNRSVA